MLLTMAVIGSTACLAQEVSDYGPPFPRIGNCYGSGLAWQSWERGREYWSKLDLFIGGAYDLHYDWEHERWPKALAAIEQNVARIREVNPDALFLPYVDVVEGPDNPQVPPGWWDLRDGERWSGWPGFFRINTSLPEVLQFNLDKVRDEVLGRECFDGVFYDCWGPDPWLVPRTAQLREGRAIVMVNEWNLPRAGFEHLNGALAEDELNRVVEGTVDFEEFLARYLRWSTESRKPVTTMLVCHPRNLNMDPWHWSTVPWQERRQHADSLHDSDPQMLRFGLTTTLLGDGYFGYDCANLGRGQWWWYPEYDAPLGYPRGPATKGPDGLWRREFDGGSVVVNGTAYDALVELPRRHRDFSGGRVAQRFTVPMFDGRILIPTDADATAGDDDPPRITAEPPAALQAVALEEGPVVVRTPGGLDLRFGPTGELRRILLDGEAVLTGGWPTAAAQPFRTFEPAATSPPHLACSPDEARLTFGGSLVQSEQRVHYQETCTVTPDNRFTLQFSFTAETELDLRMWRHYFLFPVRQYAGAEASDGRATVTLPTERTEAPLLSSAMEVTVRKGGRTLTIESSTPMSLVDHRQWGTEDYLLSAYPISGKVARGTPWGIEMSAAVTHEARP